MHLIVRGSRGVAGEVVVCNDEKESLFDGFNLPRGTDLGACERCSFFREELRHELYEVRNAPILLVAPLPSIKLFGISDYHRVIETHDQKKEIRHFQDGPLVKMVGLGD